MKRIISLFLSVLLVFLFSACNETKTSSADNTSSLMESTQTDNSPISSNEQKENTPNNSSTDKSTSAPINENVNNITNNTTETSQNDDLLEKKQEKVDERPEKITKIFDYQDNFRLPDRMIAENFKDPNCSNVIPYTLYFPANYDPAKKYPVLLLLHGAGERGNDNSKHLQHPNLLYKANGDIISEAFVICPQCPSDGWWDLDKNYYGDNNGLLSTAIKLLKNTLTTYSCDRDRIYVAGLSMGGYGTWEALSRHSDLFTAGIPICGWGDSSASNVLKDIPIWIFHGTADTTVSFYGSQSMYDAIKSAGGKKIHFTKLQNVGHGAWDYALRDRKAISWLFAQNINKNPSGDYKYLSYIEVRDPDGNIIINETDFIESRIGFLKDANMKFTITLTENGTKKLANAYSKYKGKEFSVLSAGKVIYNFTVNDELKDNKFVMEGFFKFANYAGIHRNLSNYKEFQKS